MTEEKPLLVQYIRFYDGFNTIDKIVKTRTPLYEGILPDGCTHYMFFDRKLNWAGHELRLSKPFNFSAACSPGNQ
jgi:hypothetical protein